MLKYSSDEIIEKLYPSFKNEPIRILELDNGCRVISGNGLHRYTLLRILYINELKKVKGDKEKEELVKQKYSIPVEVTKVDLFKTYCQYIIKFIASDNTFLSNEYDKNYKNTGKVELYSKGKMTILDDEQLLNYTKKLMMNLPSYLKELLINDINMNCKFYASFKFFIETYFSEEINHLSEKNSNKGRF